MSPSNPSNPTPQTHPTGERRAELERIKAAMWPPDEPEEVRKERIRQAVEALESLPKWDIDPLVLKRIVEDPENEYYG